jgi:prepilin-type N-terminal cleavage/methylation domain-containing protein
MVFKINRKQKGFTIIELIVVIGIITVLSAIVLVNVVQYTNKSKDAAIKADMDQLRTAGTVYLNTNGDVSNICTHGAFPTIFSNINKIGPFLPDDSFYCADSISQPSLCETSQWAVIAILYAGGPFSSNAWYCVDSEGNAQILTQAQSNGTGCTCNSEGFY